MPEGTPNAQVIPGSGAPAASNATGGGAPSQSQQTTPDWNNSDSISNTSAGGEGTGQQTTSSQTGDQTTTVPPQDGQQTAPDGQGQVSQTAADDPVLKDPRFVQLNTEREEMQTNLTKLRADMDMIGKMAEFYQKQYNEMLQVVNQLRSGQQQPTQGQQQTTQQKPAMGELPPNMKKPGEWASQEEIAAYTEHVANTRASEIANSVIGQVYEQQLKPVFDRIGKSFKALEEMLVKSQYKDFDEVVKDTVGEIFTVNPAGKILGVKNEALLNFIRQDPLPTFALYNYARSRKAPQIAQKQVQTATQKIVDGLSTKPKVTLAPASSGAKPPAELDWDSPKEVVDAALAKKGLV